MTEQFYYISDNDLTSTSTAKFKPQTLVYQFSRICTQGVSHGQKCQFHKDEKWQTLRKTSSYWAEEYATPQLLCSLHAEVNKFLLAYVKLFKCIDFVAIFRLLARKNI